MPLQRCSISQYPVALVILPMTFGLREEISSHRYWIQLDVIG
uniref:Uncharacterized protein n=1 Tax=Anguilla anguilla TaxID=7936 RepID=A0A0E9PPD1_ANGAN